MRISDWSSDVYSSDLLAGHRAQRLAKGEVIGDGDHLLLLLRIARAPLDEALARNPRDFNRRLADRRDPRPAMLRDRAAAEPDQDRTSTRLNSSNQCASRMPPSA